MTVTEDHLRVWDPDAFEYRRLEGHRANLRSVAVSDDGERALTVDADGEVRLWQDSDSRMLARRG